MHTLPLGGQDRALVVLTARGRDVLEANRRDLPGARQAFHAGLQRPRELTHDAQVYRAYLKEAKPLREASAIIRRVVLDNELKRDYQAFLQERNRGRADSNGRPDRTPAEIHRWAVDHGLPDADGHVQFPDARIEYEDRDGQLRTLDLEVETINYRGSHAAAKASSGFSRHSASASAMRIGGARRVAGRRGFGGLTTARTGGKGGGRSIPASLRRSCDEPRRRHSDHGRQGLH